MRKAKRIVALVLALTMMFALVAMTASAASPIQPRATCAICKSWDTTFYTRFVESHSQFTVANCSAVSGYHLHQKNYYENVTVCHSCDVYVVGDKYLMEVCRG